MPPNHKVEEVCYIIGYTGNDPDFSRFIFEKTWQINANNCFCCIGLDVIIK